MLANYMQRQNKILVVCCFDVCDVTNVTLSVYPHRASLKNMPSPMLCQLSYAVRSVRVSDVSEQNLF